MSLFTIRDRKIAGSLIAISETNDLQVEEICDICHKQGVVNLYHSENEEHKGSPNFKSYVLTPANLRKLADEIENMGHYERS